VFVLRQKIPDRCETIMEHSLAFLGDSSRLWVYRVCQKAQRGHSAFCRISNTLPNILLGLSCYDNQVASATWQVAWLWNTFQDSGKFIFQKDFQKVF